MKVYSGANIRNVAMVGMGMRGRPRWSRPCCTPRGRPSGWAAWTTARPRPITTTKRSPARCRLPPSAAYVEWGKTKINVLDTPGFNMFVHEAKMVLPVVDAAIVVVDGVAGVEVVTQRVWNYCEEYKTPRLIVVNRMDRDRADASACWNR